MGKPIMSGAPPSASSEGPTSTARGDGPSLKLPVWRKLLYGAIVTAAFFGLLELALLALGVEPAARRSDPLVGFSGQSRLFTERQTASGKPMLVTAENRLSFFNRQSFLRDKPPDGYRIFCLGGSTTYGRPYDDRTSFAGFLRAFLPEMDPSRRWEVVNAGGVSYASYRIEVLTRELAEYEPDLFVIYTGHNEFLEDRTYSSLAHTPEPVRRLIGLASWSRTFSLMQGIVRRTPEPQPRETLPAEVDAILDRAVGPGAYHRDDRWREQVIAHFRVTLQRIVDVASEAGAEIVFVVPASNLRDCTPFKSEYRDGLTAAELREFLANFLAAQEALEAGNLDEALSRIDLALRIDPRHAHAHYVRGRVLIEAGDADAARRAFLRAREEDVCPLRAFEEIEKIVREVAAKRGLTAIDFAAIVDREAEHGIPGSDWFLDHVHPTIEGNQRLARELAGALVRMGIVRPQPSWDSDAFGRIAQGVKEQIDPRDHAIALRNLAKVLDWGGKVGEADRLALKAIEHLPNDGEALSMAGYAELRRNRTPEAKAHLERSLRIRPGDVRTLSGLGEVYTRLGRHEKARACFAQVVAADPNDAPAQYNLGNALRLLGRPEEAEAAYRKAISLAPDQPDTHKNLGLVLFAVGDVDGAVRQFEAALALEGHVPGRHADLGYVLIDADQPQRAEAEFQAALEIDPSFVPAMFGMALVCERRDDLSRAVQWLHDALRIAPNDVNLHYYLAQYSLELGDSETAQSELDTVLTLDPGHADARQLRATLE